MSADPVPVEVRPRARAHSEICPAVTHVVTKSLFVFQAPDASGGGGRGGRDGSRGEREGRWRRLKVGEAVRLPCFFALRVRPHCPSRTLTHTRPSHTDDTINTSVRSPPPGGLSLPPAAGQGRPRPRRPPSARRSARRRPGTAPPTPLGGGGGGGGGGRVDGRQ